MTPKGQTMKWCHWTILFSIVTAMLVCSAAADARDRDKKHRAPHVKSAHQRETARRKLNHRHVVAPQVAPKKQGNSAADPLLPEFAQDAAELRQWLRQREEDRHREGDGKDEADEGDTSAPTLADDAPRSRLDLSLPTGPSRLSAVSGRRPGSRIGRQYHVLDPNMPITLYGLSPALEARVERHPARSSTAEKAHDGKSAKPRKTPERQAKGKAHKDPAKKATKPRKKPTLPHK